MPIPHLHSLVELVPFLLLLLLLLTLILVFLYTQRPDSDSKRI